MPKVQKQRAPRAQTSTEQKRARASRAEEEGVEMDFRCKRCEEKKIRCFVETSSGRCAGCISVGAECSLFVSEKEWEEVQAECERIELELAQAEERQALAAAESSRLRREFLEVKNRKRAFARRDLAIIAVQDRAKEQAEGSSAPGGTGPPVVEPPLSEPLADSGWLQADPLDSSFDYSFPLSLPVESDYSALGLTFVSPVVSGGNHVPVTCSP
ncbi:hypothetical protein COCHEDRAFT_1024722 [Bipolaris maydis C5]|uniref:Zn(2)-C6 fungal-type domain-containing protein n=1 Tax=Cochliobolus heterostrophus (strain C5 / ATCC 48332 / race O) TaxID=701091 RepID=M2UAJ8_COCH5